MRALTDVYFDVVAGEVHALCGENGAGKSTLIKILAGSLRADTGEVRLDGVPLPPGDIAASEAAGVAVLYQESVAFSHLNAVENIFMGRESKRLGRLLLDKTAMRAETRKLLDRLGEDIDLRRPVGELTVAQRQMIGIARALARRSRVLIMDEPTASLSARETEVLFRIVRQLRRDGVGLVYVSHRLEELFELCDRVTVLRDGRFVATRPVNEVDRRELIRLMVGRDAGELASAPSTDRKPGETRLEVRGLSREGEFRDVSFSLRAGEIVGLAGLVGAGRSELARTVFGVASPDAGEILVDGTPLPHGSVRAAMQRGLALVPEDRQHLGLVLPLPVGLNLTLGVIRSLSRFGLRSPRREKALALDLIRQLAIKTANASAPAETLSGGNQQKIVIGKWLAASPRVLLLDEPTRGVDVGAKAEIYKLIGDLASRGMATLVISSELPELLGLCDRILVMRTGAISGELTRAEATQEKILELALPEGGPANATHIAPDPHLTTERRAG